MSRTTTHLHQIVAIELQRIDYADFFSHEFRFTAADGSMHIVAAFADVDLPLAEPAQVNASAIGARR